MTMPSGSEEQPDGRAADPGGAARKTLWLIGLITLISGLSIVSDASSALAGELPSIGRVMLGVLGVTSGILLRLQPRLGWLLAGVWSCLQIPFFAWTPDGSPTSQAFSMPITLDWRIFTGRVNDFLVVGINALGIVFLAWLRAWRRRFGW
jgi:hypothetical protein